MLFHIFDADASSGTATNFTVRAVLPPGTRYDRVRLAKATFMLGTGPKSSLFVRIGGLGVTNSYATDGSSGCYIAPILGAYDTCATSYESVTPLLKYSVSGPEPFPWVKISDFTALNLDVAILTYDGISLSVASVTTDVTACSLTLEFSGSDEVELPRV